jgi:hypothetical protein
MQHDYPDGGAGDRSGRVSRYAFFGFGAIALFFLITEHRAHVIPYLPFLLLAACPLMHLFHHRGHGHGSEADPQHRGPSGAA